MVDTFMEVIKAEKSFSGPITDKDKFKESLRITAKRAIENRKYYLKQMTLTAQRALQEHQSHNMKKPYKISHAYSSGGYENDKGEDPKGKRVPTQFTIFCDLFFETFLNEPNLNSHKSDIILKAKKKYNSRK